MKLAGVLVFANGKTELIEQPAGKIYVRRCDCCGAELMFEAASQIARDRNTVTPETSDVVKKFVASQEAMNHGCIVYIQRLP